MLGGNAAFVLLQLYSDLYALYFRDNQSVEVLQLVPSRAVGAVGTGWGLRLRAHRLEECGVKWALFGIRKVKKQ